MTDISRCIADSCELLRMHDFERYIMPIGSGGSICDAK